jgi:hypothetical protein
MRKISILFIICFGLKASANKISAAFEALSIYDYFKAKQLFYKSFSKYPCESSYGLAIIYYRNDNPFSNIDSAAKYIAISKTNFKDTLTYSLFQINQKTIQSLAVNIGNKGIEKYSKTKSVESYNAFLSRYYFSDSILLEKTFLKRDEIKLTEAIGSQSSKHIDEFLLQHPQSTLYQKAKKLFYDFQYTEETPDKTIYQYQKFIKQFPNSPNISFAEKNLFNLIQTFHSSDSLNNFIKNYSTSLTREAAWKLLYSTSVKSYNKEELSDFLMKYPDYPFNETILKEIALSENILLPLKNTDDKYGYIDTIGNWVISPQFDDALVFSEGFAVVSKNNSYYYINKEGNKISELYTDEIESYKNGVAIIKKESKSYLVNRTGQIITKGYNDLNELSDGLFTCRTDQAAGAINTKGETVIPFIYKSLGKFKRGYANYEKYDSLNKFGLISVTNQCLPPLWDWISAVDTNNIVIVKNKNKFGILHVNEQLLLPTDYDYIVHCVNEIYLVVKNNLYGFYNIKDKCFVTSIDYNFNISLSPSDYTNGKYYKLIKNNEVALVDANGRYSINFGNYSDLFFAKCDIIRVQKNNKFGFIDRKLKAITPFEFEKASDFENDLAIVFKSNNTMLIDKSGKALYFIKNGVLKKYDQKLYLVKLNELMGLIDNYGMLVLNIEFESIDKIHNELFVCSKNNELFLFNSKTQVLKKL